MRQYLQDGQREETKHQSRYAITGTTEMRYPYITEFSQEQPSYHTKSYEAKHTVTHTFQPPGSAILLTKGKRSSLLASYVKGRDGYCRQVFCVRRLPIRKPEATHADRRNQTGPRADRVQTCSPLKASSTSRS